MADRKDRMALLSRYNKLHLQRYEQKSNLNINVEQWAADALIESYGISVCYDLLDFYFQVSSAPSWNTFAYKAHDLLDSKNEIQKDLKERQERRKKAKEWLSE
jgi:hypothetical protein